MDALTDSLVSYAQGLRYEHLSPEVVHQAKRVWVDTLGCAIGGFAGEPSQMARALAAEVQSRRPGTVLGTGHQTSPDLAAFCNGVAMRYQDFNDTYTGKELGHPSDHLAAVLAAGEAAAADGRMLITATVLAYEVFCRLCDAVEVRGRGFDYVVLGAPSAALAAAKALGLQRHEMAHAMSIATASSLALFQTRVEDVSMWKACAFPSVSRNALFAALLAERGLSGPGNVFQGRAGLCKVLDSAPIAPPRFPGPGEACKIQETSMKRFPVGHLAQTIVEAALAVRSQIPHADDIASVEIETFRTAKEIMAGDPEKWRPASRETADHSIPYVAAIALLHGAVEWRHFDPEYYTGSRVLELVQKVRVTVTDACERSWPQGMLSAVRVTASGGRSAEARVEYHRGHWKNPMSDAELEQKFLGNAEGLLQPADCRALLDRLWHLEQVDDARSLARSLLLRSGDGASR